MHRLLGLLLCVGGTIAHAQLPPVGGWREHLSYHHALSIGGALGNFFVATPAAVFNVSGPDNVITRYTTINGLHSIGVSAMAADPVSGDLVIGYDNSDIDILTGSSIVEVPDLELSGITGDKTIHSVYITAGSAYLSTGLGIVVVGLGQSQVNDTYVVGAGGTQVSVNEVASDARFFYAATNGGLRKASRTAPNLADFATWQLSTGDPGMDDLPCQEVVSGGNFLYVLRGDSVYAFISGVWKPWYTDGWNIRQLQVSGDSLVVSEQDPGGTTGRITWLDTTGAVSRTLSEPGTLVDPRGVLGGEWIADAQRGLLDWNGSTLVSLVPNSPDGPLNGQVEDVGSGLWVAGGGSKPGTPAAGDTSGFYHLAGDQWTGFNSLTQPAMGGIRDLVAIAVAPRGDTVYVGSASGGLVQLTPSGVGVSGTNVPVTGLTYDSTGNLWMVHAGAAQPLVELTTGGSLLNYSLPAGMSGNQLGRIISDAFGYLWIMAAPSSGALCFQPTTQLWKSYMPGSGQGNLPDPTVNCLIQDKQGLVWLGTNNGIGVVECGASIFSGGCDVTLPVVQQDAFAGYLFQGQEVLCMAVDGADRKWVGTPSGAWLISEDGERVIATFNTANSPLFNDTVTAIGIDGKTGEVFFSTPAGMCSFRGSATEAAQTAGSVLVFPNPVPPGYGGTIAIRGVPDNAIVKIAELSGRLVYQTVALGGQAVWNGNDYNGRRVATGVYLVLIADQHSQARIAAKIVLIH